jgi:hypothetical protein
MDIFPPLSATAQLNSVVICCKEFVFCPRMSCLRSGNNLTDLLEPWAAAATNVGAVGEEFLMFCDETDLLIFFVCLLLYSVDIKISQGVM